jgi:hypothetical protein
MYLVPPNTLSFTFHLPKNIHRIIVPIHFPSSKLITAINFYYWKLMWHVHVAIFKWLRCVLVLLLNPNLNSIVSLSSHCYCETHEHHYICHSQKKLHSLTSFVFLTIAVKVTSTIKKLSLSQHLLKINK